MKIDEFFNGEEYTMFIASTIQAGGRFSED